MLDVSTSRNVDVVILIEETFYVKHFLHLLHSPLLINKGTHVSERGMPTDAIIIHL